MEGSCLLISMWWILVTSGQMLDSIFTQTRTGYICQRNILERAKFMFDSIVSLTESTGIRKWNLWICLWGINYIMFIDMGRTTHCGWYHFLDEILNCIDGERKLSTHIPLMLSDLDCGLWCNELVQLVSVSISSWWCILNCQLKWALSPISCGSQGILSQEK